MIIQCTGCQKTLEVDENRFTRDRMRGVCPGCKTIIEVARPRTGPTEAAAPQEEARKEESSQTGPKASVPGGSRLSGLSISQKLQVLFLSFILITGGVVTFLYLSFVPAMMNDQIRLRTVSVARAFSGAVQQPLLVKNYLQVNQTAVTNAALPHVAYVSVLNKRGIVVAGIFGDKTRFDEGFNAVIDKEGFPSSLSARNRIREGEEQGEAAFTLGGQKVFDVAVPIENTGGEAHVGIFTQDAEHAVEKRLVPLLEILGIMVLSGSLAFIWVGRSISRPIKDLTSAAEKISKGEMDHPITVKSGGEIGELARSLERMRFSINTAMDRLMQR
jgi:HAMP domain-containing protein